MESNFGHIYWNDWQIGSTYERLVNNKIIKLGCLIKKELWGRQYDPDMKLTFQLENGNQYIHIVSFDYSYRKAQ